MGELQLVTMGGSGERTKNSIRELLAFGAVMGYSIYPLPDHSLVPRCTSSHNPINLVKECGKRQSSAYWLTTEWYLEICDGGLLNLGEVRWGATAHNQA